LIPIAFENDAGSRENLLGFSDNVVWDPPAILPLLFLPKPKDIDLLESIDGLGTSWPTEFAMLTGG
jgi:hypothetical protein